jgi:hypothetical protein
MAKPKSRDEVAEDSAVPAKTERAGGVAESVPCPRCKCASRRTGQHGDVQYRTCSAPICRKRFAVKRVTM